MSSPTSVPVIVRAVARARPRGLVIADLPYHSYDSVDLALENAGRNLADSRPDLLLTPSEREHTPEAAALFLIANLVLNLDEAVTKE